jgi:phage host-nuclease inhibitor protein Gam
MLKVNIIELAESMQSPKWDKIASDKIAKIQDINNQIRKLEIERNKQIAQFQKDYSLEYQQFCNVYESLRWH